jgi:hypothetical protein
MNTVLAKRIPRYLVYPGIVIDIAHVFVAARA